MKRSEFLSENFQFSVVKFTIYLNSVFVMLSFTTLRANSADDKFIILYILRSLFPGKIKIFQNVPSIMVNFKPT